MGWSATPSSPACACQMGQRQAVAAGNLKDAEVHEAGRHSRGQRLEGLAELDEGFFRPLAWRNASYFYIPLKHSIIISGQMQTSKMLTLTSKSFPKNTLVSISNVNKKIKLLGKECWWKQVINDRISRSEQLYHSKQNWMNRSQINKYITSSHVHLKIKGKTLSPINFSKKSDSSIGFLKNLLLLKCFALGYNYSTSILHFLGILSSGILYPIFIFPQGQKILYEMEGI